MRHGAAFGAGILIAALSVIALVALVEPQPADAQAQNQTPPQGPQPAQPALPPATTAPTAPAVKPAATKPTKPVAQSAKKSAGTPTRYLPNRFAGRAGVYYKTVWGVDSLSVKLTESGQIIRFAWRVLDAERAKPLSNKEAKPSLDDPQAGVSLVVPSMENIGMLRQSSTPEEGKTYWMAFSNKGRLVKKGHRVNVVIGQFHADGLAVDE
jgi:hypothetical protein